MNDIRRSILWVIFGFTMVMLWDQWQIYNGNKATFFPAPVATENKATTPAPKTNDVPQAVRSDAAVNPNVIAAGVSSNGARESIDVNSDVLALTLDSEGGSIIRVEFLKHADVLHPGKNIVLLDESKDRVYMAQTGLIGAPTSTAWPTHKTPMTFSGAQKMTEDQKELVVKFSSDVVGGLQLIKTYTLTKGDYTIAVKHDIINKSGQEVAPQLYMQLLRDGNKPDGESSFYSTFTGPALYNNTKKYQKVEFTDIEKDKAVFDKQASEGYVAIVQHYFASAWLLADGIKREYFVRKVDQNLFSAGMITTLPAIEANGKYSIDARFFVGPQEENNLETIYPGLELVKDYGWLTILAKPLYWLLNKLNHYLGNWGWSIVALVVLIKAAFYWLNAQAYKSMAKMKAINPKIQEMRERLKDSPQQMQQEMMKIYRDEKVNPLGGCLPIAIQIPVFIALYWVLLSTVEMRNAPWVLWIHDLAAPDTSLGVWFGVPIGILPIVMTLTTVLQTALNPAPPDPMQAKLMWIMPLAFSVMFFFFPSGLVLYWITNNVLSIAQQWLINTRMGVPPQFNLPKFR
ncbi:MAG: membrane protein insertase YidC [Betaproteobacteria bacterium]|nr:membrane protein insertase YidC [Betaproteobacteria bacterium]